MRILLLSDTHSHLDDQILNQARLADEIWHAGDWGSPEVADELMSIKPVRGVYGNIDGTEIRKMFPESNVFHCEGFKMAIRHIVGHPGRYSKGISEWMAINKPQILICGHSHLLRIERDKQFNCLYINPGAAGKHGFHKVRTLVRFELKATEIKNMEVVELYPR